MWSFFTSSQPMTQWSSAAGTGTWGIWFQTSQAGPLTHFQVYTRISQTINCGLWLRSSQTLVVPTFGGAVQPAGWSLVALPSPAILQAGVGYAAGWWAGGLSGFYDYTETPLPRTNGPLTMTDCSYADGNINGAYPGMSLGGYFYGPDVVFGGEAAVGTTAIIG